jgi:hypothetical protein
MGQIKKPIPVKLFIGMITSQVKTLSVVRNALKKKFGKIDLESEAIVFDFTNYYQREMGENLFRKFIGFKKLIDPGKLAYIKIFTNKLEEKSARRGRLRRINLDPGYITESNLILATTKGFQHRIYLGRGIFAEVTLKYQKGEFSHYEWTYPDYKTEKYKIFFKKFREIYRRQLRTMFCTSLPEERTPAL